MKNSESRKTKLDDIYQCFVRLFNDAKSKDEFEYCCALLCIRGMEGPGWDTLQESHTLLMQSLAFANAPIDGGFQIRLLLLAYCHAVEMDFIYNMLANMIQISLGERYCTDWFRERFDSKNKAAIYPGQKIERIQKWVRSPDHRQAAEVLKEMHLNDVRNAFDHSDYILYKDTFRIREGNKAKRDLFVSGSKEYRLETLIPILELAINVALMLIGLTIDSIRSYTESKRVPSRMLDNDPFQDMELIVEPGYGLTGFRSVLKHTIN